MDGDVSGRGAYQGSASRQMPLQCHRLGGGCGGVPPYQERHGQPACHDGMHPPLQHRRHPGALLDGHSGQCGRLSCRRVILYVPGAGGLPLCRGDQLQKFAQSVRHPHGGPAERHSGARGHFRPSDETGHHHQPQQIYPGTKRQRQVLFHQPSGAQLLRAGSAYPAGGHGQQLSGVVPDDPRPHMRRGRHLHHV